MLKNNSKNNNKVNSVDSNTLDYYNEDMSKKAVGKLFQNANNNVSYQDGIEGVRSISRDEYDTFNGKKSNTTNPNEYNNNNSFSNKSKMVDTQDLNDFVKNNQNINPNSNKKFDTEHKNSIKEQLEKLSSKNDKTLDDRDSNNSLDTYVHTNLPKKINKTLEDKKNEMSQNNSNNYSNPKSSQAKSSFRPAQIKNNDFYDEDYFATLRTGRLSTSDVELDYENLPYTTQKTNYSKNEYSHEPEYIEEEVVEEVDKHISKYQETLSNNETLANMVRITTSEMEKREIQRKNEEYQNQTKRENKKKNNPNPNNRSNSNRPSGSKPRNNNEGTGTGTRQSNERKRNRPSSSTTRTSKSSPSPNPTLAFVRIGTFAIILILSLSLIKFIVNNSTLKSTITEQEIELKKYEDLNKQLTELRLENEKLKEELANSTPIDETNTGENSTSVENTDGSTNSDSTTLPTEYTVQSGDNLAKISGKFYNDQSLYTKIMDANGLSDGNIYVGQVLTIPAN